MSVARPDSTVARQRAIISAVGKSLALSSNGMNFDELMKLLVSMPKEKIEKSERKKRKKKKNERGTP